MRNTHDQTCFTGSRGSSRLRHKAFPSFTCLAVLGLLFAVGLARAQEPEDDYLRIYGVIQQADALSTGGKTEAALAKYREAQTALQNFQQAHRTWNEKAVTFRMNYVAEKVTD